MKAYDRGYADGYRDAKLEWARFNRFIWELQKQERARAKKKKRAKSK